MKRALRKEKSAEPSGGLRSATWLTAFNDTVTLMLTFFILILAMSDVSAAKVELLARAVHETFGARVVHDQNVPAVRDKRGEAVNTGNEQDLSGLVIEIASLPGVEVQRDAGGVRITMEEQVLFDSGSATLKRGSHRFLMPLVSVLKKNEMLIGVEGHTDSQPIATALFPSNWELSVSRALSVVMFLEENGIAADRLSVAGYGDTKPVAEEHDSYGRQKNRRVEIKLTYRE